MQLSCNNFYKRSKLAMGFGSFLLLQAKSLLYKTTVSIAKTLSLRDISLTRVSSMSTVIAASLQAPRHESKLYGWALRGRGQKYRAADLHRLSPVSVSSSRAISMYSASLGIFL
jgi:hypothetical protein